MQLRPVPIHFTYFRKRESCMRNSLFLRYFATKKFEHGLGSTVSVAVNVSIPYDSTTVDVLPVTSREGPEGGKGIVPLFL